MDDHAPEQHFPLFCSADHILQQMTTLTQCEQHLLTQEVSRAAGASSQVTALKHKDK